MKNINQFQTDMDQKDLIEQLEHLSIPDIKMPTRQRLLKVSLMAAYSKKSFLDSLLEKFNTMTPLKKLSTAGAVTLVAVALLYGFQTMTPQAKAQQTARKSFQAISTLTQAEKDSLKVKLSSNLSPEQLLQQAEAAKDLKVLTYAEVADQLPPPPQGMHKQSPDLSSMKFLQFTDTDGSKVTVGISPDNNLPTIVLRKFIKESGPNGNNNEPRMSVSGSYNGNQGFININGKEIKLPVGVAPDNVQIKDGQAYVNGQLVSQ